MKTKRRLFSLFLFLFITAGCSDEDPGAEPTVTPALPQNDPGTVSSGSGGFFAINEVGLGPDGFVALTSFIDTPASLAGLYLCQGSECFELPAGVHDPGETVRVGADDGTGLEGMVATRATFGELRSSDGEIALFASQELDDPQAMLIYFQWGSTPMISPRWRSMPVSGCEVGMGPARNMPRASSRLKNPRSGPLRNRSQRCVAARRRTKPGFEVERARC